MFDMIKNMLGEEKPGPPETGAEDASVILCILMLEAAHADGACSADEMAHVVATLTERCGIAREDIDGLIDEAYKKREKSIDLFTFTRYLNNHYTKEEKIGVMESVWRVIHIDGRLEGHEDHFAHKLANLLRLSQQELIEAKIRARGQLDR